MIFIKVLLLDNWGDKAREVLEEVAEVHTRVENFAKYDGLITNLQPIDLRYYELGALKFVASCTTGLDHIDMGGCSKGIKIISLKGETDFLRDVWATAEHTWALILSLIRKVPFAFEDVKQGSWNREAWQGTELHGKTLGIVGYGRVGQQLSRYAESFGMNQVVYDKKFEIDRCPSNTLCTGRFKDVLRNSDIITVHVPLTDETAGMFGAEQFAMMKPGAYFINTSRGAVVDEWALINALNKGIIAGAAVDVVDGEHSDDSILKNWLEKKCVNNLIITPHIAGNTAESREKTQLFIAQRIKDFIQGGG